MQTAFAGESVQRRMLLTYGSKQWERALRAAPFAGAESPLSGLFELAQTIAPQ